MEDKNINFIINGNGIKTNKNSELNPNKSFKTMKFSIPKRNVSQEICKNMENGNSSEKNRPGLAASKREAALPGSVFTYCLGDCKT